MYRLRRFHANLHKLALLCNVTKRLSTIFKQNIFLKNLFQAQVRCLQALLSNAARANWILALN